MPGGGVAHAPARAQGIFLFVCNRWSATITEDRPQQFLFDTDLVLIHCSQMTLPRCPAPKITRRNYPPHSPATYTARARSRVRVFVICHVGNLQGIAFEVIKRSIPRTTGPPVYPANTSR